jgi:hypothetical protein
MNIMEEKIKQGRKIWHQIPNFKEMKKKHNLFSESINRYAMNIPRSVFDSYVVDWQLNGSGHDPEQLNLYFKEQNF